MTDGAEKVRQQLEELRRITEKRRLFDGISWVWDKDEYYTYRMHGHTGEVPARPYSWNREATTWTDGYLTWYMPNRCIEVKLSDGSWYYPWGEPSKEGDATREPACQHEYVDVGFMHPKVVCKFCDKEKEG